MGKMMGQWYVVNIWWLNSRVNDDGCLEILIFVLLPWYYPLNCNNKVVLISQGNDDSYFAKLVLV
jgi:hypothetical protein